MERAINAQSVDERLAARQGHSAPFIADTDTWLRENRWKLSKTNPVAVPMYYMLKARPAFTALLDNGRICLFNNAAERTIRRIVLGKKQSYLPSLIAAASAPRLCSL